MRAVSLLSLFLAACSFQPEVPVDDPGGPAVLPGEGGVIEAPGLRPALPVSGEPTESTVMHVDEGRDVSLTLDVDLGAVLVATADQAGVNVVPVGAEPTRLARIGETTWVTLRASGELVRLGWDAQGRPVIEDRVAVGAEPFDVAPSLVAQRLYVSLSQEDAVVALDARTLEVIGRWGVDGEPRWIQVIRDGDGERVIVASSRSPRLVTLDPTTGARTLRELRLVGAAFDAAGLPLALHARLSGGLAQLPDGRVVAPAVLADTDLRPKPEVAPPMPPQRDTGLPGETDATGERDTGLHEPPPPGDGGCADGGGGAYGQPIDPSCKDPGSVGRFTPVLVVVDPAHLAVGGAVPPVVLGLGAFLPDDAAGTTADPSAGVVTAAGRVVRGVPGDAIVADTPLGPAVWVPMPSEDAVVGVLVDAAATEGVFGVDGPVQLGLRAALPAADGVVAVHTVASRDVLTWGSVGRTWSRVTDVELELAVRGLMPGMPPISSPASHVAGPASPLSAELRRGRDLFTSATTPSMAASGAGVSCDTCHVDGRSDGFTWQFEDMPRQTPQLAVGIADTLPITWLGTVPTVEEEIRLTTTLRMGGHGPDSADTAALAAWVAQLRPPVRPEPATAEAAAQVARGRALFTSAEVGCASCHAGDASTDGDTWQVLGFDVATNTPTLRGLGASAPYLHDGSAETLRDLLLRVRDGSMGNTGTLTDAQLDDLEAYLKTL